VSYLRNSISAKTRKGYARTVAAFRRWRSDNGKLPDELLTADDLISWVSLLADYGRLKASTIRRYVSALSTWFEENCHPDSLLPNPAAARQVWRVLKGIDRSQAEREQARPLAAAGDENAARPLLYTTLQKFPFGGSPRDSMHKAAAFLGVAGAFRPGELLGKAEFALRREQLTFFADAAGTEKIHPPGAGDVPRVLRVTLRCTKTSQMGAVVKWIKAADALAAMWKWFCDTADRDSRAFVFQLVPGGPQLSSFALTADLERRHRKAGLGDISYYGKSLRQGGASTLAVQGYSPADIAALGWSPDSKMWELYARDPAVQRQRAIARGDLMQPSLPPPGRVRDDSSPVDRR
jgi:integrase